MSRDTNTNTLQCQVDDHITKIHNEKKKTIVEKSKNQTRKDEKKWYIC